MASSNKIRVCLVEDIETYAELLQDEIDMNEDILFVKHYTSAIEALEMLPFDQPHVVLMDIDLKEDITGIECLFRVKNKIPNAHFIMFTVFGDNDRLFDALKAGANGYVLKKDFHTVIPAIRTIIDGGSPMSKEIARKVTSSFHHVASNSLSQLTSREIEILSKIAEGLYNKEIAAYFSIKENAVKQHIFRIYKKLQVNNRVEATRKYKGL